MQKSTCRHHQYKPIRISTNQYKPIQISTSQYKSVQANTNQHKHGVSAPTPAGLSRPATRCLTRIFYPPVDFVPGLFIKHSIIPKNTPPFPKTLRHSREGGNPQFPRMREFNVPLPQRPRKTLRHSRDSNSSPRLLNEYNPAPGRSLYLLVARIHVRFYPERWQTPNLRHYLPP